MNDDDAMRRAFQAEIQADIASARAVAATESRDRTRADVTRLEKEIAIVAAIAQDVWVSLVNVDPSRARQISGSLSRRYDRYRESQVFPNITEVLAKLDPR
jgi:hypothetical protein